MGTADLERVAVRSAGGQRGVVSARRPERVRPSWGWLLLRYHLVAAVQVVGGLSVGLIGLIGLPGVLWWVQELLWTETDWHAVLASPPTVVTLWYVIVGLGWVGWLWLWVAAIHDIWAALRHRRCRPRLPVRLGGWVGGLAGMIAVFVAPSSAAAAGAEPVPVAAGTWVPTGWPAPAPEAVGAPVGLASAGAAAMPETSMSASGPPHISYLVHRGDWLGAISARYLGDFTRYRQLQRLNPDLMPDNAGRHGPDHIEAGWRLILPADAVDRGPRRHAGGVASVIAAGAGSGDPSAPAQPTVRPPAPSSSATPPAGDRSKATASPVPARPAVPASDGQADSHHPGVQVPGGWITAPFAGALAAAAVLALLRRRHRSTVIPTIASDVAGRGHAASSGPLPTVMRPIRRAARQLQAQRDTPQSAAPTVTEYNAAGGALRDAVPPIGPSGADLAGLGARLPAHGLYLLGPGAASAARALLVATLSSGTPDDPDAKGHIIASTDTLVTLLGTDGLHAGWIPRLHVTSSLAEALTHAEELLIERQRQLAEHDAADMTELHRAAPYHPPLPPILLLAHPPTGELRDRLAATLRLGAALHISGVLLGAGSDGDTVTVDVDGHTSDGRRCSVLDAPTTWDLLEVLREAHTGQPPTPKPRPAHLDLDTSPTGPPPVGGAVTPSRAPDRTGRPAALSMAAPADQAGDGTVDGRSDAVPGLPAATLVTGGSRRAVRIRLFGEPTILGRDGSPVTGLRHHARELLVFLTVHRTGADLADIMEAFWPAATVRRAAERLSTEVGNLRRQIRQAAADTTIQPVVNTGGRYHLDPNLLDIDVWQFADALRQAKSASRPADRVVLLRAAIDLHAGPLAEGQTYDWIELPRDHLRQQHIQARRSLAESILDDDPAGAAELLRTAAALDPTNEDLARLALRTFARLRDTTGVRTVLHGLRAALADIDEQPSPATVALATQLEHDLAAPSSRRHTDGTGQHQP